MWAGVGKCGGTNVCAAVVRQLFLCTTRTTNKHSLACNKAHQQLHTFPRLHTISHFRWLFCSPSCAPAYTACHTPHTPHTLHTCSAPCTATQACVRARMGFTLLHATLHTSHTSQSPRTRRAPCTATRACARARVTPTQQQHLGLSRMAWLPRCPCTRAGSWNRTFMATALRGERLLDAGAGVGKVCSCAPLACPLHVPGRGIGFVWQQHYVARWFWEV